MYITYISAFTLYQPCLILCDLGNGLTWSAPKFCRCYAARSDLPRKSRKGIIFNTPTNLSFVMQHAMLLSKLRSKTMFSLQPFTSHWCTIKRSHSLSFDSAFTTITMTNFRTSPQIHWLGGIHDTNQYTYQSIFLWKHYDTKDTPH